MRRAVCLLVHISAAARSLLRRFSRNREMHADLVHGGMFNALTFVIFRGDRIHCSGGRDLRKLLTVVNPTVAKELP